MVMGILRKKEHKHEYEYENQIRLHLAGRMEREREQPWPPIELMEGAGGSTGRVSQELAGADAANAPNTRRAVCVCTRNWRENAKPNEGKGSSSRVIGTWHTSACTKPGLSDRLRKKHTSLKLV
ncbi:hypothetical protein KSP40_PGU007708 [Platanthera guangdongensis]|uniref:Uncharacterized protein n=1 Tax=Platanthera guangdongensis TaxID=2320717 RepID=A0ABR2M4Z7_9ASPA